MHILGVDLEDQKGRAVVVDEAGHLLRSGAGTAGSVDALIDSVTQDHTVAAAGFAADWHVASAPPVPPAESLKGVPRVECDPGLAAVTAETWIGAARGARDAVCLVIGDRVAAGILLGGQPWRGAHGRAGSAAWFALNPVERQDYRKFGSLAAEVSSGGIARRLSWRIQAGDTSAVLERAGDVDAITAAHVFDAARTGDGLSVSVIRDTAKYIGMAAANLAAALDPEVVVIGGNAALSSDLMLDAVRQEFERRLPPGMGTLVRLEMSALGEDGVAIGAARMAMLAQP
jgi:glucokinase